MHFVLLLTSLLVRETVQQVQDPKINCYDYAGYRFGNNTQCPGSRVCCLTASECTPNRMCNKTGTLINPPCSTWPWNDSCSRICQYGNRDGFLPRIAHCADGSYCCDNDPACCSEGRGIVMDGLGGVARTQSGTSTSTSSTVVAPSNTAPAISSASATPTTSPVASEKRKGLGGGGIAGIVIGVIGSILLVGALLAFFLIRRHRRSRERAQVPAEVASNIDDAKAPQYHEEAELDSSDSMNKVAMGAAPNNNDVLARQEMSAHVPPQEMSAGSYIIPTAERRQKQALEKKSPAN
ncbi:MAG: hypothetical protein M1816_005418 [Peltula sp. TS41687]|nr:MAG: hypothetical protein M1816_005418 [Peltula sp. TS41687]